MVVVLGSARLRIAPDPQDAGVHVLEFDQIVGTVAAANSRRAAWVLPAPAGPEMSTLGKLALLLVPRSRP